MATVNLYSKHYWVSEYKIGRGGGVFVVVDDIFIYLKSNTHKLCTLTNLNRFCKMYKIKLENVI